MAEISDSWKHGIEQSVRFRVEREEALAADLGDLRRDHETLKALVESHVTRDARPRFEQHDRMHLVLFIGRPEEGQPSLIVRVRTLWWFIVAFGVAAVMGLVIQIGSFALSLLQR